jgi:hypothetical protein
MKLIKHVSRPFGVGLIGRINFDCHPYLKTQQQNIFLERSVKGAFFDRILSQNIRKAPISNEYILQKGGLLP